MPLDEFANRPSLAHLSAEAVALKRLRLVTAPARAPSGLLPRGHMDYHVATMQSAALTAKLLRSREWMESSFSRPSSAPVMQRSLSAAGCLTSGYEMTTATKAVLASGRALEQVAKDLWGHDDIAHSMDEARAVYMRAGGTASSLEESYGGGAVPQLTAHAKAFARCRAGLSRSHGDVEVQGARPLSWTAEDEQRTKKLLFDLQSTKASQLHLRPSPSSSSSPFSYKPPPEYKSPILPKQQVAQAVWRLSEPMPRLVHHSTLVDRQSCTGNLVRGSYGGSPRTASPPRPPTGSRAATPSKLRPPPASSTPAALRSAPAPPTSRWSPPDRKYLEEQRLEQRIADALAIVLHEKPLDAAGRMANLLSPARRSSSTTQAGGVDDEVAAEWHAFAASEAAPESSAQASAREAAEFNAKIRVNLSSAVSSASWPAQPQAALAIRIIAKWVHKLARRRRKLRVEWEAQMEAERERETKRVAPLPKRAPRLQLLWRRMQSADEHGAPLIDVLNGRAKDEVKAAWRSFIAAETAPDPEPPQSNQSTWLAQIAQAAAMNALAKWVRRRRRMDERFAKDAKLAANAEVAAAARRAFRQSKGDGGPGGPGGSVGRPRSPSPVISGDPHFDHTAGNLRGDPHFEAIRPTRPRKNLWSAAGTPILQLRFIARKAAKAATLGTPRESAAFRQAEAERKDIIDNMSLASMTSIIRLQSRLRARLSHERQGMYQEHEKKEFVAKRPAEMMPAKVPDKLVTVSVRAGGDGRVSVGLTAARLPAEVEPLPTIVAENGSDEAAVIVATISAVDDVPTEKKRADAPKEPSRLSRLTMATLNALDEPAIMAAFGFSDKDGSGELSRDEFKSVIRRLNYDLTESELSEIYHECDPNGDGFVTVKEFLECRGKACAEEVAIMRAFQRYDKDGSGALNFEELKTVMLSLNSELTDSDMLSYFNECDSRKDGKVTGVEFDDFMARHQPFAIALDAAAVLPTRDSIVNVLGDFGFLGVNAAVKRSALKMLKRKKLVPPTMHRNYSAVKGKTLQVFLSSTFRDMNAERAIFTKRYAPSLRLLAKSRGLFITFVDLRWGVTVEQATSGAVVSICLERLASSRYFVNFLGLRYGWMPAKEDLTQDTFNRFGHIINSYIPSRSVTEFEVLGGALGWNSKAECAPQSAWFYMRDDAFCDSVPEEERPFYVDADPQTQKKLTDLKKRIRARAAESDRMRGASFTGAKLPIVECCRDYEYPEDFAEMVYNDLTVAIKRDFPDTKIRSELDVDFVRHLTYGSQFTQVYVGHSAVQEQIDAYVRAAISAATPSATPAAAAASAKSAAAGARPTAAAVPKPRLPLVVVGNAGTGKSAAIANWLMRAEDQEVTGFVLPHFCNSTANSTQPEDIVKRLAEELKRAFNFENQIPTERSDLLEMVPIWLAKACETAPVTILIDGIDHLKVEYAADGTRLDPLSWVPSTLHSNCSIILSTASESPAFAALVSRGWADAMHTVQLPALTGDDKQLLTSGILSLHHKVLEPHLVILIVKSKQTGTPLFLQMCIEELMANAVFETVDGMLRHCLAQKDMVALADMVLQRIEGQFGALLVQRTFSYLKSSRAGVSEIELLEALQINQADSVPFFDSMRPMLCQCGGLLSIASNVVLVAVTNRYLPDEAKVLAIHKEMYDFFLHASAETVPDARRYLELPFQLTRCQNMEKLSSFLIDMDKVRHLLADENLCRELPSLWIKAGGGAMPADLGARYHEGLGRYAEVLRKEAEATRMMELAARTDEEGNVMAAEEEEETDDDPESLYTKAEKGGDQFKYLEPLAKIYGQAGAFLVRLMQYEGAIILQQEVVDIERSRFGTMSEHVAEGLRQLSATQFLMGRIEAAMSSLYRAIGIYSHHKMTGTLEYAETLFEMSRVARYTEDIAGAKNKCLLALHIFQKVYGLDDPRLAPVLNRLACLMIEMGPEEQDEAVNYATRSLKLCTRSPLASADEPRFDSSLAEAMWIVGANHFKCARIGEACRVLEDARVLAEQSEGPTSLLVAGILEDLAFALIRRRFDPLFPCEQAAGGYSVWAYTNPGATWVGATQSLPARGAHLLPVPQTVPEGDQAAGAVAAPGGPPGASSTPVTIPTSTDDEAGVDAKAIEEMIVRALAIRRKRNPGEPNHPLIAHNLLRMSELFWAQGRFAELVKLYERASEILGLAADKRSKKQVAQLASWTASAWLQAGKISNAEAALKKAEELSWKVFGESSWEAMRILRDKISILQASATPAKGASAAVEAAARKAYATAERFETRCVLLLQSLNKTIPKDEVLPLLSHYAPVLRERQWHELPDAPSAAKPAKAQTEGSSSSGPNPSPGAKPTPSPQLKHGATAPGNLGQKEKDECAPGKGGTKRASGAKGSTSEAQAAPPASPKKTPSEAVPPASPKKTPSEAAPLASPKKTTFAKEDQMLSKKRK